MEALLIAEEGLLKGLTLILEEGEQWTIGRDPESCELVVEDPKASRQHAIFRLSEEGIFIENLSLTNPVMINGQNFTAPQLLNEGDLIKIGTTLFRFTKEKSPLEIVSAQNLQQPQPDEENRFETIHQEFHEPVQPAFDLNIQGRWLLKVVAGPQNGAEFSMEQGRIYTVGTDTTTCDIVFYDLSVSRQHARVTIDNDNHCYIEDLKSRNGTLVDGKLIDSKTKLTTQQVVTLGTSAFVVIDREKSSETIYSAPIQKEIPEEELQAAAELPAPPPPIETAPTEEEGAPAESEKKGGFHLSSGTGIILLALLGLLVLSGIGIMKLFTTHSTIVEPVDYDKEIKQALSTFPSVSYNYNASSGSLFLVGHVLTSVDRNQLLYNLSTLKFIEHVDDTNVIVDQLAWQEMNSLLSKNPTWNGISMYSSSPGHFILTGYLKTRKEAAALSDFVNRNFQYVDRLENRVVVEEDLIAMIQSQLHNIGLTGVQVQISNGEVSLTGFIPSNKQSGFEQLLSNLKPTPGIRTIRNYVALLAPEEAIINLSDHYKVTGYAKLDEMNVSVIINGRILTRGDVLDGMTITSIQPNIIFLEKNGLKFKINYNQ